MGDRASKLLDHLFALLKRIDSFLLHLLPLELVGSLLLVLDSVFLLLELLRSQLNHRPALDIYFMVLKVCGGEFRNIFAQLGRRDPA